jgi:hypothetical protein
MRRFQRLYVDWQRFVVRWFIVGIILVLLFALGFLLFSPVVHVRTIHVKRTDPRLDIDVVQQSLAPLFGRHTVFLSELEVLALLRDAVPDLDEVEVHKAYPAEISVTVTLDPIVVKAEVISPDIAQPPLTATGGLQTYLTSDGMLVETTLAQPPDLPVVRLVDWGARPQPGDTVLPVDFFVRMRGAEEELTDQFSLVIRERTVFIRGQEFHLLVVRESGEGAGGDPVVLWFDLRSPLSDHLQRYRSFLRAAGPDAATEYIDLRLQDRVVYK